MAKIKQIRTQRELQDLARKLDVRSDWHEPDEQGLTALSFGKNFDNAGFWGLDHLSRREQEARTKLWDTSPGHYSGEYEIEDAERFVECFVVLYKEGRAVAEINLATLFAFACGTDLG